MDGRILRRSLSLPEEMAEGAWGQQGGQNGPQMTSAGRQQQGTPSQAQDYARVRVHLRLRPLLQREVDSGVCVLVREDGKGLKVYSEKSAIQSSCHSVWPETASQQELFDSLGECAESALQGFNNTILAYGQTGTGKTYTMLGGNYLTNWGESNRRQATPSLEDQLAEAHDPTAGIIPRLMLRLFELMETETSLPVDGPALSFKVNVSYMEIYNEKVYDLLSSATRNLRGDARDLKQERVTFEVSNGNVPGLTACEARSASKVMSLVRAGNQARAVRHTNMNQHSSRSHAILQLVIDRRQGSRLARSKVNLVDLAGSERWDDADMSAARVQEMTSINQGLSALASVVVALQNKAKNRQRTLQHYPPPPVHIPYRDSKLTHILMDSLGGNCKTTLIATLSPSMLSVEENISTVRFADRVRAIQNRAVAVQSNSPALVLEAKEAEIQRLKGMLTMLAGSDVQGISAIKGNLEAVMRELEVSRQELAEARRVLDEERLARHDLEAELTNTRAVNPPPLGLEPTISPQTPSDEWSGGLGPLPAFQTVGSTLLPAIRPRPSSDGSTGGRAAEPEATTATISLPTSQSVSPWEEGPTTVEALSSAGIVTPNGALAQALATMGLGELTKQLSATNRPSSRSPVPEPTPSAPRHYRQALGGETSTASTSAHASVHYSGGQRMGCLTDRQSVAATVPQHGNLAGPATNPPPYDRNTSMQDSAPLAAPRPPVQREYLAIGGILGEIGQIRSELRNIISTGAPTAALLRESGSAATAAAAVEANWRRAQQSQQRPSGGARPGNSTGGRGSAHNSRTTNRQYHPQERTLPRRSAQGVSSVYSTYGVSAPAGPRRSRGGPHRSPSSARHHRSSASGPSPQHQRRQRPLEGLDPGYGRQALGAGNEVYLSPAMYRAAVGPLAAVGAAGWGRSVVESPDNGAVANLFVEQRSDAKVLSAVPGATATDIQAAKSAATGAGRPSQGGRSSLKDKIDPAAQASRSGRSSLLQPGRGVQSGATPRDAGATLTTGPSGGMDTGTWIYLMGSRGNYSQASKLAAIDSLGGFDLAAKYS